jgi:uncharacterized membrane protein YagU involved in acid resistance
MNTSADSRPHLIQVIAGAGLLIGTLDIADAIIFYALRGIPPFRILQGIAAGLLGRASFTQGSRSAFLGLLLHFFIAFTVATVYILLSRRFPLSRHPFLYGTVYGIAVYCVMNYIILPLSKAGPRGHFSLIPFVNGIAALIFFIGIPVALIARRYVPIPEKTS